MRSKFAIFFTICIYFLSACAPATEVEDHTGHITTANEVVYAESGKITMDITNNHDEPVTLDIVYSRRSNLISMEPDIEKIEIPGGKTIKLSLKSKYFQMWDIGRKLVPGEEVFIKLHFSDGHLVKVRLTVKTLHPTKI